MLLVERTTPSEWYASAPSSAVMLFADLCSICVFVGVVVGRSVFAVFEWRSSIIVPLTHSPARPRRSRTRRTECSRKETLNQIKIQDGDDDGNDFAVVDDATLGPRGLRLKLSPLFLVASGPLPQQSASSDQHQLEEFQFNTTTRVTLKGCWRAFFNVIISIRTHPHEH